MLRTLRTIDAHTAGQPLRLLIEGAPRPTGTTMLRKQQWMARHADDVRMALMCEPRGHADMCGALLTEPVSPGAHAGVLFMHHQGYTPMCGHGIMAVTTIAVERGLVFDAGAEMAGERTLVLDTVAGTVRSRARVISRGDRRRVEGVTFSNVPSFVAAGGQEVMLRGRALRVDVAFGGAFYAIVDTEAIGVPLDAAALPTLRGVAQEIAKALEKSPAVSHPVDAGIAGLDGVIFTGPPRDPEAHLRNATVFADGAVDRSPCGTGTSAVMAVLDAMGLLPFDQPFVHESLLGTLFRGRVARRTRVGEIEAIVADIEGAAWVTGEHTFLVDEEDPLKEGFTL